MLIYFLTKFYLGFTCGKKKKSLNETFYYCQVFTVAVVCVLLNNLLIVLKGLGSSHSNLRIK